MDYIYDNNGEKILIEQEQSRAKEEVIEQFIRYRKSKKMTQEDLAKKVGVPRTNITRFESGRYNPSLEMMVKVATALGMKLSITLEEQ
ncbi:MAG: helix-turn-helix transcriptional regulator [Lachnospiraceae bacterium]|nr:helix-turn-helix transcriptional regulator [Lachnospiraceae bacterium]